METEQERADRVGRELKLMSNIAYKVREYAPGPLGWISWQKDPERDDVYGFVLGKGFASCSIEEATARQDDDAFIRSLAAQILGFEVDSDQDIERRVSEALDNIHRINKEIAELERQREVWASRRAEALRLRV